MIAKNCDWFIALFVPVVIGRSNCFGLIALVLVFRQSFEMRSKVRLVRMISTKRKE